MPRLPIYTPQSNGARPYGSVNPDLRVIESAGRSEEQLGATIADSANALYKRDEQNERTLASSAIEGLRASGIAQMQSGLLDGTFDTTKFLNSLDEQRDNIAGSFDTAGARDYFENTYQGLKAQFSARAKFTQAKIAYNNAALSYKDDLKKASGAVAQDPTWFPSAMNDQVAAIDRMPISDTAKKNLIDNSGHTLALSAAESHTTMSYNQAVDAAQKFIDNGDIASAQKIREHIDKYFSASGEKVAQGGAFGDYLGAKDYEDLFNHKNQLENAASAEIARRIGAFNDAKNAERNSWQDANFKKLQAGQLSAKDIIASPLSASQKETWFNMARKSVTTQASDPAVYNRTLKQILAPDSDPTKIKDFYEVANLAGNGLSVSDVGKLKKVFDDTPQGRAMRLNRSQIMKIARGTIVQQDVPGQRDPLGEEHLQEFMQSLLRQEEQMAKDGKDPSELYDPNSKHYFANPKNLMKYVPTFQERAQWESQKSSAENGILPPEEESGAPGSEQNTQAVNPPAQAPTPKNVMNFQEWLASQKKAK